MAEASMRSNIRASPSFRLRARRSDRTESSSHQGQQDAAGNVQGSLADHYQGRHRARRAPQQKEPFAGDPLAQPEPEYEFDQRLTC